MTQVLRILRSTTAAARPAGKTYGEPYWNDTDKRFGIIQNNGQPIDIGFPDTGVDGITYGRLDNAWAALDYAPATPGVDGNTYAIVDDAWSQIYPTPQMPAADGLTYAISDQAWTQIFPIPQTPGVDGNTYAIVDDAWSQIFTTPQMPAINGNHYAIVDQTWTQFYPTPQLPAVNGNTYAIVDQAWSQIYTNPQVPQDTQPYALTSTGWDRIDPYRNLNQFNINVTTAGSATADPWLGQAFDSVTNALTWLEANCGSASIVTITVGAGTFTEGIANSVVHPPAAIDLLIINGAGKASTTLDFIDDSYVRIQTKVQLNDLTVDMSGNPASVSEIYVENGSITVLSDTDFLFNKSAGTPFRLVNSMFYNVASDIVITNFGTVAALDMRNSLYMASGTTSITGTTAGATSIFLSNTHLYTAGGSHSIISGSGNITVTGDTGTNNRTAWLFTGTVVSSGMTLTQAPFDGFDQHITTVDTTDTTLKLGNETAAHVSLDASGDILLSNNSGTEIRRDNNTQNVTLMSGTTTAGGAHVRLSGSSHASTAQRIIYGGSLHRFMNVTQAYEACRITTDTLQTQMELYATGAQLQNIFNVRVDGGVVARISDTGNVGGTGAYTDLSDESTKEDIEDISPLRSLFDKIRPRRFRRKGSDKFEYGFVAQELEAALPEAVVDFEGYDPENPGATPRKGVQISQIVAVMVEEIKALRAEIADLKAAR